MRIYIYMCVYLCVYLCVCLCMLKYEILTIYIETD